jgi:hypothetical protein
MKAPLVPDPSSRDMTVISWPLFEVLPVFPQPANNAMVITALNNITENFFIQNTPSSFSDKTLHDYYLRKIK